MKKIYVVLIFLMTFFINSIVVSADYVKPSMERYPKKYNISDGDYTCQYWFQYNDKNYYLYLFLDYMDDDNDNKPEYYTFAKKSAEFWEIDGTDKKSYKISGQFNESNPASFKECLPIYYDTDLMSSPKKFRFFSEYEKYYKIGTDLKDPIEISNKFIDNVNDFGFCYISKKTANPIWIPTTIATTNYNAPSNDYELITEYKIVRRNVCVDLAMVSKDNNNGVCYGYDVNKAKDANYDYKRSELWLKKDADISKHSGYNYIIKTPFSASNYSECSKATAYSNDDSDGKCYICDSDSSPYAVWYYSSLKAPEGCTFNFASTKQKCEEEASIYGKACYICKPSSEYAYGIWIKKEEIDSECSDYILSVSEKSEYACFEEAKKYRIKNGGPEDYTPPQKGKVKSCGGKDGLKNIPARLVDIVNAVVTIIQIVVPIILIILGMIDFAKAAVSQKEDEINKGKKVFFSRLITGLILFLVVLIVKMAVGFVSEATDNSKIVSCIDCFISGKCQ